MWLRGWIEGICTTWSFALSEVSSSVSFILPCTNTHGARTPTQEHTGKNKRTRTTSPQIPKCNPWAEYKLAVPCPSKWKIHVSPRSCYRRIPNPRVMRGHKVLCRSLCVWLENHKKKHLLLKWIDGILIALCAFSHVSLTVVKLSPLIRNRSLNQSG